MRRLCTAAVKCGLCLALASPALAQIVTGGIAGIVKDKTGAVLPGASVSVSGPNIVGSQTAVSNERGLYRVINLPPGSYDLQFALQGFETLTKKRLPVGVGTTVEANAVLEVSGVTEQVEVVADAGVVDTSSNEIGVNFDREFVKDIPVRRNSFFDLVAAAPGSLQHGDWNGAHSGVTRTMVYGSSYDDNAFKLDGVDITDNYWGEALAEPNIDAIEEIEVLSLGAPAEYGNAPGAVYNIVTRQGTNEFHGDVNFFTQPSGLTSNNLVNLTNPDGSFVNACPTAADPDRRCPYVRDKYQDFTAQLGGPVVKDKLWFFASYQRVRDYFSEAGVDPSYGTARLERDRFFGKLNWQLSKNHKLVATFHRDSGRQDYPLIPNAAPETAFTRFSTLPAPGLGYTGVLSENTVLEVRYSGFYGNVHGSPTDPSVPAYNPHILDLDTGQISGGNYYFYEIDPYSRQTASAKLSHFADNFLGADHDFRFGVQYGSGEAAGWYTYNDFVFTYVANGVRYAYGYHRPPFTYNGATRSVSAFVDDTVRVNERLSLNLGVRYDNDKAFSNEMKDCADLELGRCTPTGITYPRTDYFTWNAVSPRLGFNWNLTSDGKTVLKAFWGRYHRAVATAEFANILGASIKPFFFGSSFNFATGKLEDLVEIANNKNLSVSPDYKSPYTDQFTVRLERELARNLGVGVNYVHKYGENFAAWEPSGGVFAPVTYIDNTGAGATGRAITVYQLQTPRDDLTFALTNDPRMWLRVNAVDLTLLKRMSGRWSLNSSLTWMRSTGRLAQSREGVELRQLGGMQFRPFGRDPNDFVNTDGRQRGDVEWQFRTQFVGQLPWDFQVSANISSRSGANLIRQIRVSSVTNMNTRILGEKRGEDGRLPSVTIIDLRLEKAFKLGDRVQLRVSADAFNLFNEDAPQTVRSSRVESSVFNWPARFVRPRQIMLGAKLRF